MVELAGVALPESSGYPIDANHSGIWYNSDQSGHGYVLLILPDNRVSAQWYVYDDSGNQVWLIGTGSYEENSDQVVVNMTITQNGMFPPEFNSQDVEVLNWGTLTFKFDGCYSGTAQWDPLSTFSQFSAGSINITKLAELSQLTDCENEQ